jgi:hypothetical protein
MTMNYPDNFNAAAFEARYGSANDFEFSNDTLTAAAMVHLAGTCGLDWCEADGWLDECLLDDEPRGASEIWQEFARDELRQMFFNRPGDAAKQVADYARDYIAERKRDAAKRAVIKFIASLAQVTA